MTTKAQVIFDNGKPRFVVLPYADYVALTGNDAKPMPDDNEFVPFVLSDYIKNPIRVMRIEAGLNQEQLAKRLGVTQGYISKIESRSFQASAKLLARVNEALTPHKSKRKPTQS
jgi:DNA-binding XRE family transcriptional regulator